MVWSSGPRTVVRTAFDDDLACAPDPRIIYVFDDNLEIMVDDSRVISIVTNARTTTAESLNMALSLVRTDYVCALNLDDFYYPGTPANIMQAMKKSSSAIGCADWKIDEVKLILEGRDVFKPKSLSSFPTCSTWPPTKGEKARLGSGDASRGTLGPAPVYLTEVLKSIGGYRNNFANGSPIRKIIDYVAWKEIEKKRPRSFIRVPEIGGSYYSDPESQQEFRDGYDDVAKEHALYNQFGVV